MGPVLDHDYIRLELPQGWQSVDAPGGLFARFKWSNGAEISVLLAHLPPPQKPELLLHMLIQEHSRIIHEGASSLEGTEPALSRRPGVFEARRTHTVAYGAQRLGVITRFAVSELPIAMRGGPLGHVTIRVSARGPADSDMAGLARLVDAASLLAVVGKMHPFAAAAPFELYPYLLPLEAGAQRDRALEAVGRPAEGFGKLPVLANGLHLTLAEETPGAVRPLFPADLADMGIVLAAALGEAAARVGAKLGTEELPARVVWTTPSAIPPSWHERSHLGTQSTGTTALFVVGPSWMAGSVAMAPALYAHASSALGARDLMVLIPHRDMLFVFADRGEAANRILAEGIARAEHDGRKPLSNIPVRLTPAGVEARIPRVVDEAMTDLLIVARPNFSIKLARSEWKEAALVGPVDARFVSPDGHHELVLTAFIAPNEPDKAFLRLEHVFKSYLKSDQEQGECVVLESFIEDEAGPTNEAGSVIDFQHAVIRRRILSVLGAPAAFGGPQRGRFQVLVNVALYTQAPGEEDGARRFEEALQGLLAAPGAYTCALGVPSEGTNVTSAVVSLVSRAQLAVYRSVLAKRGVTDPTRGLWPVGHDVFCLASVPAQNFPRVLNMLLEQHAHALQVPYNELLTQAFDTVFSRVNEMVSERFETPLGQTVLVLHGNYLSAALMLISSIQQKLGMQLGTSKVLACFPRPDIAAAFADGPPHQREEARAFIMARAGDITLSDRIFELTGQGGARAAMANEDGDESDEEEADESDEEESDEEESDEEESDEEEEDDEESDEESDEDEGDEEEAGEEVTLWEEASAIVGPWPDDASCRTALQHALGETGFQLSAHIRGCSIARIRHIGTTSWLSAEPALIVPLTDTLEEWQIFGVQVEYGPSGNRAVGVQLMHLDINDQRELVVAADLGSEPEDRDALDAALDWEIGLATHWLELPDETPVTSTMIFYTEQRG